MSTAAPCFRVLRTTLLSVVTRAPSLRRVFLGGEGGRRPGGKCLIVATSHKLTKTCGRGVAGVTRRGVGRSSGLFIVKCVKHGCFKQEGTTRVSRSFFCAARSPAVCETEEVTRGVVRRCMSKRLSRICVVCAGVVASVASRPGVVHILPLGPSRCRFTKGKGESRVARFRPSMGTILSHLTPGCVGKLICNTVMRSFSDRLGTEVVTVRNTDGDTERVVESLKLVCGHTHRTTVARRVARIYTKTGSLGGRWR